MKRIIALLLTALLALGVTACGSKPQEGGTAPTAAPDNSQNTAVPGENSGGEDGASADQVGPVLDGSRVGVLQPVKNGAVKIKGLIIASGSGHHDYPAVEELLKGGYKTEGLYAEYFLNEWFDVYADIEGGDPVGAFVLPHDPNADCTKMTAAELAAASEQLDYPIYAGICTPDPENNGLLFSAYVNAELNDGLYDLFFTGGEDILYVVQLNITPEPVS